MAITATKRLQEIVDLYHKNLINVSGEVMFGLTDVNPSKLQVQGAGALLYNLMELRRITIDDIYDISKYLQDNTEAAELPEEVETKNL